MMVLEKTKGWVRDTVPLAKVVYRRGRRWLTQQRNRNRSVRDVFEDVYARHLWCGSRPDFNSGSGSDPCVTAPYIDFVRGLVAGHAGRIQTIVDLGCGDFRVGSRLQIDGVRYIGVDVVRPLIEHHQARFGTPLCDFVCADATQEALPAGDLLLIRQVLQHLANEQIASILQRARAFPFVLVTEHHPAPGRLRMVNRDKTHGPNVRVAKGSGVYIDKPPFSLPQASVMLEVPVARPVAAPGEILRTYLVLNPS
jgi:hypothetical protein